MCYNEEKHKDLLAYREVSKLRIDRVKLIAEMARQDVTNIQLAAKSGVSRVTVTAVRCGKSCSQESAERIARALGVDVTEIMEDAGIDNNWRV